MASKSPTDEILVALSEVGLRLVLLGERPGDPSARWAAMVAESKFGPEAKIWDGHGPTPAAALISALKAGGVNVDDSD